MTNTIWQFKTKNFRVVFTSEPEYDPDLSWDETGETQTKIETGEWVLFCAKIAVFYKGAEIASDYLGNCIYESADEFVSGHRDTDPMNRNCSILRAVRGNVTICHYFPDMVRQAVSEARAFIADVPELRATA